MFGLQIIEDIKNLPLHDYEIVLVSPDESWSENPDIKFIHEKRKGGTVRAMNAAYKNSSGDFVIAQTDDHRFSCNYLDLIKSAMSEAVSKDKIRIGNGSLTFQRYGSRSFHKPTKTLEDKIHPISEVVPPSFPCDPYSIVSFPMVFREDVERHMQGVISNESFHSFYHDSWTGVFVEKHNCKQVNWPSDVWVDVQENNFAYAANKQHLGKDHKTFLKLLYYFNLNPDLPYNFKVNPPPEPHPGSSQWSSAPTAAQVRPMPPEGGKVGRPLLMGEVFDASCPNLTTLPTAHHD